MYKSLAIWRQNHKKQWKIEEIRKIARCRLQIKFSILPIFGDFPSMKCFKIPISLSKLNLIFYNDARFARINETFLSDFQTVCCIAFK